MYKIYNRSTERQLIKLVFISEEETVHRKVHTLLIKPTVAPNYKFHKLLSGTNAANATSKTLDDAAVKWWHPLEYLVEKVC